VANGWPFYRYVSISRVLCYCNLSTQPQTTPEQTTSTFSKKPDSNLYPKEFRPLINAIFKLSDGYIDVPVDYEAARAQIGTMQNVQALGLGWNTFYDMVKAAVNAKYVEEDGKLLTALKVK
jgi:hypothetical protein